MAKLTSSAPVLFVRDVRASAEHYRDTMGFRFDRFYGEPPSFVILGRDGLHVMLKTASDHSAIIPPVPPKTPTTSIAPFCPVCVSV